jgi:hypothetical protein
LKYGKQLFLELIRGFRMHLVYADDMNPLGDSVDTIKKNTQTLIYASKEVGLEVNTEKYKYMFAVSSTECSAKSLHEDS